MATAQFAQRGATPNLFKSDLDMDSLFDFNQGTFSPRAPSRTSAHAGSSKQAVQSFQPQQEEAEAFSGPSHEYDRFPQQTGVGVSVGDMNSLANLNQPMPNLGNNFGGFNSGIDESSFGMGWDMDSDMNMDMGNMNMYFPGEGSKAKFVDPSYIDGSEEPQSNVGRLWPGMHQQAALAKQQQQPQPHTGKGKGKANSQADPHTEESISRLLNQMRQNSNLGSIPEDDVSSQNGFMSNMSRMKKDEEDMDEDERLLASDEGKKLSSKERRQLRNKVSARAFRSRRKEYIGQLEGEVATKAQEVSTLKTDNQALSEENARYRALIQTLLRHPSFTPFIEDLSKDPAFIAAQGQGSQSTRRPSAAPAPQATQAAKQQAMIPEAPVDLSMLNINNANFPVHQNMNFDFSQPQFSSGQYVAQLDLGQSRQANYY